MSDRPRPSGSTVFCDDVRAEIDGKLSLIGAYATGVMFVGGGFPATLPKFGLLTTILEPHALARRRQNPAILSVYVPGETERAFITHEVPVPDRLELEKAFLDRPSSDDLDGEFFVRMAIITLAVGFSIPRPGTIRVRLNYDGEIIKCGTLRVEPAPPANPTEASQAV